jgi:excinuclease ABC subunit B
VLQSVYEQDYVTVEAVEGDETAQFVGKDLATAIAELEKKMRAAAADLEFEEAARLRDELKRLEALELGLQPNLAGRSLQASSPRQKEDWKPKPLGPGGGGYDPKKGKGGRGRRK